MFPAPVVLASRDKAPTAVLKLAVVFAANALLPTAVFDAPVVLA